MIQNKFKFPIFTWHLEISSKCALACDRCPRTGADNKHKYEVTEISLEKFKSIFTPELIESEVENIVFCGGLGDPIYHTQLPELVRYLKSHKPSIELVFVTNGSYRKREWWASLARELNDYDRIIFSVDGWDQESNEKYRAKSNFESILVGIEEMTKSSAVVSWSTILFRFNQDKIEPIRELARSLGVNFFTVVFSSKFGKDWFDASGQDPLQPSDEFVSAYGRLGSYQSYTNEINPKPRKKSRSYARVEKNVPLALRGEFLPRCMTGEREPYIDASGIFYPCCWFGHPHDMPLKPGQKNPWLEDRSRFDLKVRTLEEVLNDDIWLQFFETWNTRESQFVTCEQKCNGYQVKPENLSRKGFELKQFGAAVGPVPSTANSFESARKF